MDSPLEIEPAKIRGEIEIAEDGRSGRATVYRTRQVNDFWSSNEFVAMLIVERPRRWWEFWRRG